MAYDPMNPFGLPSPDASGASQNPLLASMDMMRQAMTGLGQSAQANSSALSQPMTPEDLEQKINDLKVVENWLKLNLSMLSSSIQGLEVQLATVRTLRSFVAMGDTPGASPTNEASPLEVALGLKPAPRKASVKPAEESVAKPAAKSEAPLDESNDEPLSESAQASASGDAPTPDTSADADANTAAAQAWWKMLENQFNQLASATTQANAAAQSAMAATMTNATPKKSAGKAAGKSAGKAASKTAAKAGTKAGTKTATKRGTKTAAKKATKSATTASRNKNSRG